MQEATLLNLSPEAWHTVRAWAEEGLRKARMRNDSVTLDHDATQALRGEIKVYKQILDEPNKALRHTAAFPSE